MNNNEKHNFVFLPVWFIGLFLVGLCLLPSNLFASANGRTIGAASPNAQEKVQTAIAGLLKKAKSSLQKGDLDGAATSFYEVYLNFPDATAAKDALWQAARLRTRIAANERDGDYEQIRDLFRSYINYFPKSARIPEAYLELGISYYHMHFYPEALSYFKLFIKKYRGSPLLLRAMKWERTALLKVGKKEEAAEAFTVMMQNENSAIRTIGKIGMGYLLYTKGRYREAKDSFQSVLLSQPDYYLADPELLRMAGMADIKFGKTARGQQELFHYLSIENGQGERSAVLSDLADSYYVNGDYQMASSLFGQVIKSSAPGERGELMANLRLAQYKDKAGTSGKDWTGRQDTNDISGDKPYLAVLDGHYKGFILQEARYGLFKRYKARNDLDGANNIGRSFLRSAGDYKKGSLEGRRVKEILSYIIQEFLRTKKYQDVYDLYFANKRHLKKIPDGRLLYMVGQAMEKLGLYDQAAVVYYRALKWPIAGDEKADLYFRRAHVYLLKKDYKAAGRLLTYLRKLYRGTDKLGETLFYSGQLAAANGDKKGALDYYQGAAAAPIFVFGDGRTVPEKRTEYASRAIALALELGAVDRAGKIWRQARQAGGFAPTAAQEQALGIGNAFRQAGQWDKAAKIYRAGLAKDLPEKGGAAMACNLYMGDSLTALGDSKGGIVYYRKAAAGDDSIISKMAVERLRQNKISSEVGAMKKVLGR